MKLGGGSYREFSLPRGSSEAHPDEERCACFEEGGGCFPYDDHGGFQDALFDNANGCLEFFGNKYWALWLGDGKSDLWFNSVSRMGVVYNLIVRKGNKPLFANKDRRYPFYNIM